MYTTYRIPPWKPFWPCLLYTSRCVYETDKAEQDHEHPTTEVALVRREATQALVIDLEQGLDDTMRFAPRNDDGNNGATDDHEDDVHTSNSNDLHNI